MKVLTYLQVTLFSVALFLPVSPLFKWTEISVWKHCLSYGKY